MILPFKSCLRKIYIAMQKWHQIVSLTIKNNTHQNNPPPNRLIFCSSQLSFWLVTSKATFGDSPGDQSDSRRNGTSSSSYPAPSPSTLTTPWNYIVTFRNSHIKITENRTSEWQSFLYKGFFRLLWNKTQKWLSLVRAESWMVPHQKSGTRDPHSDGWEVEDLLHPWHCKWSHQTPQPNRTIPPPTPIPIPIPPGRGGSQIFTSAPLVKSENFGQDHSAGLSIQHVTAIKINPYAEPGL